MTLDIFNNQITLKMSQYMMNQEINHKTKLGPTIEMGTFLIYRYCRHKKNTSHLMPFTHTISHYVFLTKKVLGEKFRLILLHKFRGSQDLGKILS